MDGALAKTAKTAYAPLITLMFKPKRAGFSGSSRGGKSFGKREPWKKDSRGGDAGSSAPHDATCADCGKPCKVPFKPNGKKPVFCINCFKKEGNAPSKAPGDSRFAKPAFGERRSFSPSRDGGSKNVDDQLKTINAKLDSIIEALNS